MKFFFVLFSSGPNGTRCEVDSQHRRRQRDAEAHRVARQDEERRSQERIRDASDLRLAREDPATRREEQQQNTAAHQESRADPRYRAQEQQANTTRSNRYVQAHTQALGGLTISHTTSSTLQM